MVELLVDHTDETTNAPLWVILSRTHTHIEAGKVKVKMFQGHTGRSICCEP